MKQKKYNHSFARRLTRWVMGVLSVLMIGLAYLVYSITKDVLTEVSANTFHSCMQTSAGTISDAMSDISIAVQNNVFDIERSLTQPDQLQGIVERIIKENPRMRSCGISFVENYYRQKGSMFCPYAFRNDSMQVVGSDNDAAIDDYLEAKWFHEAVAADSAYWSMPFFDSHNPELPLVAYIYPIHDAQGRLAAILGADLSLDFMTKLIHRQDSIFLNDTWSIALSGDKGFKSYVLLHDGTYITHGEKRRILKGNFFHHIKDVDEPGLAKRVIQDMSNGDKSHDETEKILLINRESCYLFYTPLEDTEWILAVSVPKLGLDLFGIFVGLAMMVILAIMLIIAFFVSRLTIAHVAKPLKQLAATADEVANGQFNAQLPNIKSHDEIHLLRDSFENMQHSLVDYMEELKETTTAKASMESELKIAHDIQMSMLPKTYPAFPERHDIDIYGEVMPAKAVGGDLYDFFIHDEKLFFCIGDVSGKGVPASLVMAVTRSLFRNIASYVEQPDRIVAALNDALSDSNETGMFVTLFLGVLDLATGHLCFSNAGHNPPLMLTGGDVQILDCDANIPLGIVPAWTYNVQQLQFHTGDCLLLYTDGLNEAENKVRQQFGMERMEKVAKNSSILPRQLIETMTASVQLFVDGAEQSDDLTMLAIRYTNTLNNASTNNTLER